MSRFRIVLATLALFALLAAPTWFEPEPHPSLAAMAGKHATAPVPALPAWQVVPGS